MLGIDKKDPPKVSGEFAKKVRKDLANARKGKVAIAERQSKTAKIKYYAVWK